MKVKTYFVAKGRIGADISTNRANYFAAVWLGSLI
jgi:hypothetical protein